MLRTIICALIITSCLSLKSQTLLDKSFSAKNTKNFVLFNFNGDIKVKTSKNDEIKVNVKLVSGEMNELLEIGEIEQEELLAIYLKTPCMKDATGSDFDPRHPYQLMNSDEDCKWEKFEFEDIPNISFEVSVPVNVNVYVSTINDGEVVIENVSGEVHASNVNGNVSISKVSKVVNASTVNGDVHVAYDGVPQIGGSFKTINGDIELSANKDAMVNAQFKSFSGDFYTDFEDVVVDEEVQKESKSMDGTLLKINEYTEVKIGGGGTELEIETFNGNAYLRKN